MQLFLLYFFSHLSGWLFKPLEAIFKLLETGITLCFRVPEMLLLLLLQFQYDTFSISARLKLYYIKLILTLRYYMYIPLVSQY